jgi:UDP-3-O-[3-hydroxymyristoyl] glucosamine N-acyltransferase
MIAYLLPIYGFLIASVPLTAAVAPIIYFSGTPWIWPALMFSPVVFLFTYILTTGILSQFGKAAIIKGKFPRDLKHPVYGRRRLYGLSWTAVYYFTPVYFFCLSFRFTRTLLFRLFGYKGSVDITVYPDSWIRDLPLLQISDKVYISNRATIGTNMCLTDGSILVDPIRLDESAMVGHLAMVAPGAKLGKQTELGVGNAFGIKTRMGTRSKAGPTCTIMHGVAIGENVDIGSTSYVGLRARIADNIAVPPGANLPAGATINLQQDMDQFYTSETKLLNEVRRVAGATLFQVASVEELTGVLCGEGTAESK